MTQTPFAPLNSFARTMLVATAALVGLLPAAACSPVSDSEGPARGAPSFASPAPPPQVVLPDGAEIALELAITPDELAQGLMYRPSLPEDRGMLLIFSEQRLPSIWMMNTLVALDLVYLDDAGVVVDIIQNAQPCPGEPCPRFVPKRPARAVLEIVAGAADRHRLGEGDRLEFDRVPGYPEPDDS